MSEEHVRQFSQATNRLCHAVAAWWGQLRPQPTDLPQPTEQGVDQEKGLAQFTEWLLPGIQQATRLFEAAAQESRLLKQNPDAITPSLRSLMDELRELSPDERRRLAWWLIHDVPGEG
jgi:hypothetical protein